MRFLFERRPGDGKGFRLRLQCDRVSPLIYAKPDYIGFDRGRQQIGEAEPVFQPASDFRGRDVAGWETEQGEPDAVRDRDVQAVLLPGIQCCERGSFHGGKQRHVAEGEKLNAGARDDNKMAGPEQVWCLSPTRQLQKRIKPDDEEQLRRCSVFFLERMNRVDGVRLGGLSNFHVGNREGGVCFDGMAHHFEPVCGWRQGLRRLVRGIARRNEDDAIEAEPIPSLNRDREVATVNGVERSAEQADFHIA